MTSTDYMSQGKKEDDDSSVLTMHKYEDSKSTLKEQKKTNYSDQKLQRICKDQ